MATSVPGTSRSMTSTPDIVKQGIYETSSEQLHPLGARLEIGDGRVFHYAKNSSAAILAMGKLNSGVNPLATHLKCAVAESAVVGATKVKLTLGAAAAAVNLYAEGYLNIDNGASAAYHTYKIKDHLTIALSTAGYFNLFDPLITALTITTDYATLTQNPWKNVTVTIAGAAQVQMPVGVSLVAVPISYYHWSQTWGPIGCLLDTVAVPVISDYLMSSAALAGALLKYAVTASRTPVGWLMRAEAATDYGLVFLTIAP